MTVPVFFEGGDLDGQEMVRPDAPSVIQIQHAPREVAKFRPMGSADDIEIPMNLEITEYYRELYPHRCNCVTYFATRGLAEIAFREDTREDPSDLLY